MCLVIVSLESEINFNVYGKCIFFQMRQSHKKKKIFHYLEKHWSKELIKKKNKPQKRVYHCDWKSQGKLDLNHLLKIEQIQRNGAKISVLKFYISQGHIGENVNTDTQNEKMILQV